MNKMQQSGSIVLACLIVLVAIAPRVVSYYKTRMNMPDFSEFEAMIAENYKLVDDVAVQLEVATTDTVFSFDPNTATYDDFLCLGLSEKISANIVKYRKSGGIFRKNEDFARIYGITDSIFSRLSPYIKIAAKTPVEPKKRAAKKKYTDSTWTEKPRKQTYQPKEQPIVELNSADSAQLVALRGIGSVLANRIMTYRDMLGGFYSVEQLREVRKLPPETYANLYSQFTIDTSKITRINLNDFKYKQLSSHPYMSVTQLNAIMNYKKLAGKFNSVSDLLKYKLVDSMTYEKISPYLEAR